MSPRLLRTVVAIAAVLAVCWLWSWWRSPQRQIYRRLDALVGRLDKDGEEGGLSAVATAHSVLEFFAPGFLVRARPYEGELRDAQQLAGAVLRFRGDSQRIAMDISQRELTLDPAERTGTLLFVANAAVDRGGGPDRASWRVRSLWIRDSDGAWRISELELLEPLQGRGLGF